MSQRAQHYLSGLIGTRILRRLASGEDQLDASFFKATLVEACAQAEQMLGDDALRVAELLAGDAFVERMRFNFGAQADTFIARLAESADSLGDPVVQDARRLQQALQRSATTWLPPKLRIQPQRRSATRAELRKAKRSTSGGCWRASAAGTSKTTPRRSFCSIGTRRCF